MMTNVLDIANEKMVPANNGAKRMQRLCLQRFKMALTTYGVAILTTLLVTNLGLGMMSGAQWATFIGLVLLGNCMFFLLFHTKANLRFSDPSLTREQILFSGVVAIVVLYALPEARLIVLQFWLPAFSFGMLRLSVPQYLSIVPFLMALYAAVLAFEFFQDRQGFRLEYELFLFTVYGILLIWFAFFGGFVSNIRRRLQTQKKELQKAHQEVKIEMENRKRAQIQKDKLIIELKDALKKVKTLSGMLPICASCKKIRDDKGYWNQIEGYIQSHSDAEFSHGICPDCAKKLFSEFMLKKEDGS
jgi:hypothetical protein